MIQIYIWFTQYIPHYFCILWFSLFSRPPHIIYCVYYFIEIKFRITFLSWNNNKRCEIAKSWITYIFMKYLSNMSSLYYSIFIFTQIFNIVRISLPKISSLPSLSFIGRVQSAFGIGVGDNTQWCYYYYCCCCCREDWKRRLERKINGIKFTGSDRICVNHGQLRKEKTIGEWYNIRYVIP